MVMRVLTNVVRFNANLLKAEPLDHFGMNSSTGETVSVCMDVIFVLCLQ